MNLPRIVDARAWIGRRIAGYVRSKGGAIRDGSPEDGYVVAMGAARYATYTALSGRLASIEPSRIGADVLLLKEEYAIYSIETARGWPTDAPDHALRGRTIACLELLQALVERPTTEEPPPWL